VTDNGASSERPIPHSLEAERAVLGSILLDNKTLKVVRAQLRGLDDFYSQRHRLIFEVMESIADRNQLVDVVTLSEELEKKGLLEKAGGAAYLSAITDGVPISTNGALGEYCQIVREKATLRAVITSAQNIIAHALQGSENAETLLETAYEQIQDLRLKDASVVDADGHVEVIGKVEPGKKPAAEQTAKTRYPKIRETAWHPLAETYLRAVQHTSEAADAWHFISFYTTVGALFGGSVRGRMAGTFTSNLYSVLVGYVGGDGKTGSMRRMFDFATMIDDRMYIPRAISSAPGFIKNWAQFNQKHSIEKNTRAILRLGELVTLLDTAAQSGTHSIIPMLNDAYDGEPLSNESIQSPFRIERPYLSAIFASASKYLRNIDDKDLETGFGRRLCFCPGDPKAPMAYPPDPDPEILIPLAKNIKETILYWENRENNRIELAPSAKKLWEAWYKRYKARLNDDDLISAMTIGDRLTVQKIALINAAMDRSERYIEDHHLEPAIDFGEYLYESRFPLFSEHGANPFVEMEKRILSKVPESPSRVRKRWVQRQLGAIDSKTFNDRVKHLTMEDGPLKMKRDGTSIWLWKS
jgi:DnaB-like helicase N terminal domain/Protein of unknown function (DUF3987)